MPHHGEGDDRLGMFENQAPATLNQVAILDTWYPILAALAFCRVYEFIIRITTTGETLEIEVTIDGNVKLVTVAAGANTSYVISLSQSANPATERLSATAVGADVYRKAFHFEGHSIAIRARKTTNVGGGSIQAVVEHGVLARAG